MIILMNRNPINVKAADIIKKTYHIHDVYDIADINQIKKTDSEFCIIVDLDDETQFNKNKIAPELFASKLIELNLPVEIKNIFLFVSEIASGYPISVYAHQLARQFAEKFDRKMPVHIVSLLNYDMTVIALSGEQQWHIYGIMNENLPFGIKSVSSELLPAVQKKELIWEGSHILDFMKSPQQTFDGIVYAWR